jgi:hypothetical protein
LLTQTPNAGQPVQSQTSIWEQGDFTMQIQSAVATDVNQLVLVQKKMALASSIRNGVNWFFWIAGLSMVNSVIFLFGGSLTFVVGLGITQFIDGFTFGFARQAGANWSTAAHIVGFGLDIAVAGVFVGMGLLGRKGYRWAMVGGMALYALDGLIFLAFQLWLALAFHAFALWGLWTGLRAMNALRALEQNGPIVIPEALIPTKPTQTPKSRRNLYIVMGVSLSLLLCLFASIFIGIPLLNGGH